MGNAHWLLGAHLMARGEHEHAVAAFAAAAAKFEAASRPVEVLMVEAYRALALRLERPDDAARAETLAKRLAALEAAGTDDAKYYAEQVRTAERAFRR
jgi:hypothetical protein